MIYGNIDGIRKSALDELESLYKAKTPKDEVCSLSIMETISRVSSFIEREVSVAIDRRGNIKSIAIGDSTSVEIETLDIREKKLAGVRIIHTHPNGMSNLSALDISALIKLKLDIKGKACGIPGRTIPLPSVISAGCGLAWRAELSDRECLIAFMKERLLIVH